MATPRTTDGHVQPGDLVALTAALRVLMAELDRSAYLVGGSFARLDPALETMAVPLRPLVQGAADSVYRFLELLEKTPEYQRQQRRPHG